VTGRVTATSNNQTQRLKVARTNKNCSSNIRSFDSFRSKFFAKVISRFKSFSQMNIIREFIQVCFWWKCLTSGAKGWNTHESIASESLHKIRTKFYEVSGHVWIVKS